MHSSLTGKKFYDPHVSQPLCSGQKLVKNFLTYMRVCTVRSDWLLFAVCI